MPVAENKKLTIVRWTKFTFYGWMTGVVLILLLSSFLDSMGIEHMQFYLGMGMAAGVGIFQWLLMKKALPVSSSWIWFSIAGLGVPFIVIDFLPTGLIEHKLAAGVAAGAVMISLLQFLLLKKYSAYAYIWIPACTMGWMSGAATIFIIDLTMKLPWPNLLVAVINLLLILAGGVVLGIVSGLAIKRILS